MNTVAMAALITLLAGLVAGSAAAAAAGTAAMVAGAVGGLVLGATIHPGVMFIVVKAPFVGRGIDRWIERSTAGAWTMGILLVLYLLASPFIAWWLSRFAVSVVIGIVSRGSG